MGVRHVEEAVDPGGAAQEKDAAGDRAVDRQGMPAGVGDMGVVEVQLAPDVGADEPDLASSLDAVHRDAAAGLDKVGVEPGQRRTIQR